MSEAPEAPREFEPVDDAAEIEKLVREAGKTFASAIVWTEKQEHVINTHFSLYSDGDKIFYIWIPKELDVAKFTQFMSQRREQGLFFSVSLSRANIFFRADFKSSDEGGLKFASPEKIFKVQRRSDLRFPIPEGHVLKLEFADPLLPGKLAMKKALDVSAGGVSFIATHDEEAMFRPGLILKRVSFTLAGKRVECEAEIRHSKEYTDRAGFSGVKVGLLFLKLKPSDAQHIASYVFEESRKFYAKFM